MKNYKFAKSEFMIAEKDYDREKNRHEDILAVFEKTEEDLMKTMTEEQKALLRVYKESLVSERIRWHFMINAMYRRNDKRIIMNYAKQNNKFELVKRLISKLIK